MRVSAAGDMRVQGVNGWNVLGYSIGTPVLYSCQDITDSGTGSANYKLITPVIQTDILRGCVADQISIEDDVIISGNTHITSNSITLGFTSEFSPVAVSQNTSAALRYAQLRDGIITGLTIASGVHYTLPLGSSMGSNMEWLGNGTSSQYGQSLQWSIINTSSTTGNINIVDSVGQSYVGNKVLTDVQAMGF